MNCTTHTKINETIIDGYELQWTIDSCKHPFYNGKILIGGHILQLTTWLEDTLQQNMIIKIHSTGNKLLLDDVKT